MENGTNMGMEIQRVPEIQTVDAILVENPSLAESEVVVESGMVANIGPAAPAQVADNALIVLPAPSASDEMLEVQWLTVQPPPAGPAGAAQGLADHPAALYLARLAPSSRQTMSCVLGGVAQTLSAGRHTL